MKLNAANERKSVIFKIVEEVMIVSTLKTHTSFTLSGIHVHLCEADAVLLMY